MNRITAFFALALTGVAMPAMAQISGGTCSNSSLNGPYKLTLTVRNISTTGVFTAGSQQNGQAVFDGIGKVTMTGTANGNTAQGQTFSYSGTYAVGTNCLGTLNLAQGSTAAFALVVWSSGSQFDITGTDATSTYSGSGTNVSPIACATPTLSGAYIYSATGFSLTGTALSSVADESGLMQFDGQGNVTSSYTVFTSGATPSQLTATGTYTVASNCLATLTLKDSNGKTNTGNWLIDGAYGQNAGLILSNSGFVRSGQAHSAFSNPAQSIANVASYAVNATPPGSVFVLFGQNLATKAGGAPGVPLPPTIQGASVTVNGETAPLFYADTGQIDAQMPWDIPGNAVATVIVKNASGSSNATAVYVPAGGTPGISFFPTNRAVVVNKDNTVNTSTNPAAVGDEVVVYFTGGGPVNASGKLTTGSGAPAGLSPIVATATPTITVGGVQATNVPYIGLTPGSVGLYQANFFVPQVAKGAYPVVITIGGTASNTLGGTNPNPVMNVSN